MFVHRRCVFCVVTRLATWSKAIPGVLDETMRGDSMTVAVFTGRTEGVREVTAKGKAGK